MKINKKYFLYFSLLLLSIVIFNAYNPIRNFVTQPSPWPGNSSVRSKLPIHDPAKKTVFIIADHKLTEMFDMLAPFYLFNTTGSANVYIVAKEKTPILIKKDLFVSPQLTFREADSLQLPADVIVIPALSIRDEHQDTVIISWIKKHFTANTKMLTICDGASTGAATGLYDGKSMTAHASDFDALTPHFKKPLWVQNVTVTKSGNLFSTAGVSNAVEGSLTVIGELFDAEITKNVAAGIHYPHAETRLAHQSIALSGTDKFTLAKKVFFKRNKTIAVLLENGINEFTLATILDTYSRTFPASFNTYMLHDSTIQTQYGLSLIYKDKNNAAGLDELHLLKPGSLSGEDAKFFGKTNLVRYENIKGQYLFDICLQRIAGQYGEPFGKFVKISLDYN